MFLDAGPAILILGPILAPSVAQLGVEPVHFAVVMCVNLTIGLATPPMGLVLFAASGLTGEGAEKNCLGNGTFFTSRDSGGFLDYFCSRDKSLYP